MEQKNDLNYNNSTRKVYKDKEIWVGSLLGGTLAAGYMVAENFKALGEPEKVRKTWFVTIAATVFLFYLIFFAPYLDRIPNNIFTLVWTAIIVVTAQIFQGEKIREYIRLGGQVQSWWKTLACCCRHCRHLNSADRIEFFAVVRQQILRSKITA